MTDSAPSPTSPLPSASGSAGIRIGCLECEAWLNRISQEKAWRGRNSSDGDASRSVTDGAAPACAAPEATLTPPLHDLELRRPSIRERAFEAAQRMVLADPFPPTGHLQQNRRADRILELAERFDAWMRADRLVNGCAFSPDEAIYAWDFGPSDTSAAAQDQAGPDPVQADPIDAYIASDNAMMQLIEKLQVQREEEHRIADRRLFLLEARVASLMNEPLRRDR